MAGKFYAVKKGRKPGIYMSWDACKAQVMGFPNARYKGFKTKAEAQEFLNPDANELMQIDEDTLVAYVDGSYDHSQKMVEKNATLHIHIQTKNLQRCVM